MKPTALDLQIENVVAHLKKGRLDRSEFDKSVRKSGVAREHFLFVLEREMRNRGMDFSRVESTQNILISKGGRRRAEESKPRLLAAKPGSDHGWLRLPEDSASGGKKPKLSGQKRRKGPWF